MLDQPTVRAVFGAVVAKLHNPQDGEFISARNFYVAGLAAGLDMRAGDAERRGPTLGAITNSFGALSPEEQNRALNSLVGSLLGSGNANAASGAAILDGFGLAWDGNKIVPAGVLDERERAFLPATSANDLAKAVDRLSKGDESGAISAACGAVDLATGAVYEQMNLGDPGRVSFSAKINTALGAMKVFEGMREEFVAVGLDDDDAEQAATFLRAAINDSSQALQILRKRMDDVHGTRPALRSTAYDAIKFASAICALFKQP